MTDEELAAIKARADAATLGPWRPFNTDDLVAMNIYGVTTGAELWADDPEASNGHEDVIALTMLQTPRYACHASGKWEEDAEFIAHARMDIPALLAEVERLRAALNQIASWREGPQVNSTFDEPAAAKVAREALGYGNV